jgi:hypothetical protein
LIVSPHDLVVFDEDRLHRGRADVHSQDSHGALYER